MSGHSLLKEFFRIIFPPICISCRQKIRDGLVCGKCMSSTKIRSGFLCPTCDRRLPPERHGLPERTNPPPCHPKSKFVLAAASFYENAVVRELIHVLKYRRIKEAAEPIAEIIGEYITKTIKDDSSSFVIIPIPLHPRREKERGFNQSALIAEIVATESGFPIQSGNLTRTGKTNPQIQMKSYEERKSNVAGCFQIKKPELVAGQNIILVDDVFTSGATMKEATKTLKNGGAKKIIGFVVAKA